MDTPDERAANLLDGAQEAQFRVAITWLTAALAVAVVLARADIAPAWRLSLFLPFFFAAVSALGGLYAVCPFAARAGQCVTREGHEDICDPERLARVRAVGRSVLRRAFAAACVATTAIVALPT